MLAGRAPSRGARWRRIALARARLAVSVSAWQLQPPPSSKFAMACCNACGFGRPGHVSRCPSQHWAQPSVIKAAAYSHNMSMLKGLAGPTVSPVSAGNQRCCSQCVRTGARDCREGNETPP